MINRILVATDLSEHAARAEVRAAMLCQQLGYETAELCTVIETGLQNTLAEIMNVAEPEAKALMTDQAMRELDARLALYHKDFGVRWTGNVRFGYPAQELAVRSEDAAADLIVLGAHGSNFLSDIFLGNTADKLIRAARRPLLIVKNEPQQAYRKVLVAVDFSDSSRHAAQLALRIAPEAAFTFLHAFSVWFEGHMRYASVSNETIQHYRIKAREQARMQLNQFVTELQIEGRDPIRSLDMGTPSGVIRDYAERMKPDLIAMGKHGRSYFEELFVGSVTRDTLDRTIPDVLIALPSASA